ncbi:50S ribosomal protein L22 [Thermanaerovibrio acidaminovorans]|jgi:large subunit ribosomal protein L22|uniref:Large ribosomal subunit protein uL22 n=1 Tax=Thermanaerovibrio acidaminovorans (strain ATCC 49978 / DSM 6589 / Su883) TaxID=525903 RepID=D1B5X0_THEAS|nr:50S ribosomal protein L22 [Thermanaerovibrio acidaminovorans]ACZ19411.1 ribosomal protein L22 [Thermanaerovibrio acidaminovorans DSM 6589]
MEAKAVAKRVRIAASKVRQVLPLIRGREVGEALMILKYTPKKGARVVEKVLKSAVANAEHNYGLDVDKLVVVRASADQGSYMKRFRPVSMGRAHAYRHHTSHITVVVAER